jgi:hypothetical protein
MDFRLAELLPFRWLYVWTLLIVAVVPIALWIQVPMAFAAVAALTRQGSTACSSAARGSGSDYSSGAG